MKMHLFSLLITGSALAQQPIPPAGPLLKRAPELSTWTVTYAAPRAADEKEPAAGMPVESPRRIVVIKTGDIRHAVITDAEGKRTEMWSIPGIQGFLRPEWKEPLLSDGSNAFDAFYVNFAATDFPGFEWVSAKNFHGLEKVGDRDCLVFQDRVRPAESTPEEPLPVLTAFVDLSTRLPVKLDNGGEVTNYRFDPPPVQKLSLPPEVHAAIEARAQKIREMARKPARPF